MLHLIHQGGNPGRGFASGLASSLTASTVQNLGGGKIATVIVGSLSGGVGASVVGGDFYQGAVFGLISSSLNHVAHEVTVVNDPLHDGRNIWELSEVEFALFSNSETRHIVTGCVCDIQLSISERLYLLGKLFSFVMPTAKLPSIAAKTGLKPLGLGSTVRTTAANLTEQLSMKEALSNPAAGQIIQRMKPLTDPRWSGWRKMQYEHIGLDGNKTIIHYNGQWNNGILKAVDNFKFK